MTKALCAGFEVHDLLLAFAFTFPHMVPQLSQLDSQARIGGLGGG